MSDVSALVGEELVPVEILEGLETQLELAYRELACLEVLGDLNTEQSDSLKYTEQALDEIKELNSEMGQPSPSRYSAAPVDRRGLVGRPVYDIPKNQLQYLLQCRFTVPQISMMLNVSVRTIRRRMEVYNLFIRNLYSAISDEDLDTSVKCIQDQFGFCGNRQMQGHLLSGGIRVQQHRIRESQRRVDPGGVALRRLTSIKRRKYKVSGPLALWHIDGNHKLIR